MAHKLSRIHRELLAIFKRYGIGKPVTVAQMRESLPGDISAQENLHRRIRALRDFGYRLPYSAKHGAYILESEEPTGETADTDPIPGRLKAEVLLAAGGRCQMCGKTVAEDGIRLVVDHRVPRKWHGRTERENLWPICEECNIQKRHFFAAFDPKIMRHCMKYEQPIQRIGELLKVFAGKPVPRQLLEVVGQDEQWSRRLRELRELGWNVETLIDTSMKGRQKYVYRLVESKPWPPSISVALEEHRRAVRIGGKPGHPSPGSESATRTAED